MTTFAPPPTSARAIASPSPFEPPVTSATLLCQNDMQSARAAYAESQEITDLTSAGPNVGLSWLFRKRRWLFTSSRAPPPGVQESDHDRLALPPGAPVVVAISSVARIAGGAPAHGGPRCPSAFQPAGSGGDNLSGLQ